MSEVKVRANYLIKTQYDALDMCCNRINIAFEDMSYLVGSCLARPDFRDVDVRMIFDDEKYFAMFPGDYNDREPKSSLLCIALSTWLSQMTGLRVDFQFMPRSWSTKYFGDHKRSALGVITNLRDR